MNDYDDSNRWTLAQCELLMDCEGNKALRTWGVPMDYSGMQKTRDLVPYKAKTLEAKTKHLLSGSPEFAPRTKSVARYADQNLKQRFPTSGPQRTRQSPCVPYESGPNCLPGMEAFMNERDRAALEASK